MFDELHGQAPTGQTYRELGTETKHPVVPAALHCLEWARKVGMLRADEFRDLPEVDLDLGHRLRDRSAHSVDPPVVG